MSANLLATKLYRPSMPAKRVERPHLVERLNEGLTTGRRLALVSAPAGFGKTTCVSAWLDATGLPAAWLSLEQADNDPGRFFAYLVAALQTAVQGIGLDVTTALNAGQIPSGMAVATGLANDILSAGSRLALVLDDFHVIRDQAILDMLQVLIAGQPPNLCLVLVTREDPPLPLARLRANNQITEIRAADLRFSESEAGLLLNVLMDLALAPADLTALANRTEGWAAGLQLAGLSMRGRPDPSSFIAGLSGSHRFILSYLTEEVLDRQPPTIRDFLLQTSILEKLNGNLCEAVLGRPDCSATLEQLYTANLFLIPLDDEREWYRYHHLFAQLLGTRLRQTIPEEAVQALHRRASDWLAAAGYRDDAVRHALAGKDFERAVRLVEQAARSMIYSGRMSTLRAWLAALPPSCDPANPRLEVYRTWIDLLQGKMDFGEAGIQARERMIQALPPSLENDRLRVELTAILCRYTPVFGDPAATIRLVEGALPSVPEGDVVTRARLIFGLGVAYALEGDEAAMIPAFDESLRLARAGGDDGLAAQILDLWAQNHANHGRLREAARCYQAIIDLTPGADTAGSERVARAGGPSDPAGAFGGTAQVNAAGPWTRPAAQDAYYRTGLGHLGLAGIDLEGNDLAAAGAHLAQGTELCARGGLDGVSAAYSLRARLRQARGDLAGAAAEIDTMEQVFRRPDDPGSLTRRTSIAKAQGDTTGLHQLIEPWLRLIAGDAAGPRPTTVVLEVLKVAVARALLATGDGQRAIELLDEVVATAEPGGRRRPLLEAFLLKSLALEETAHGTSTPAGRVSFRAALELAEPEGYVRLFLEEGPAVIPLLRAVRDETAISDRLKAYADRLLSAFDEDRKPGHLSPGEEERRRMGSRTGRHDVREGPTNSLKPQHTAAQQTGEGVAPSARTTRPDVQDAPAAGDAPPIEPLTEREREILRLIGEGRTNEEIAGRLVITLHTVKKHSSNIFGKLGVSNRTQAVAHARRLGLLQ